MARGAQGHEEGREGAVHTRVAVLTATKRFGGLDVTCETLRAQTHQDFVWIIADELQEQRREIVMEKVGLVGRGYEHFDSSFMPTRPAGYYSNLPAIYNYMIERAIGWGCELAVSLQDYIWAPRTGLAQFARAAEEKPGALIAGLCSMLRRPDASFVANPRGLWSVFVRPWEGEPFKDDIEWRDVRADMYHYPPELSRCHAGAWEMNWAAFPLTTTARFDETYGEHIGHENVQFALACKQAGSEVYVQTTNHALSLPHRHYFAEEWDEQQAHRAVNMRRHLREYGALDRVV